MNGVCSLKFQTVFDSKLRITVKLLREGERVT